MTDPSLHPHNEASGVDQAASAAPSTAGPSLDPPRARRYARVRLALFGAGLATSAAEMAWFALSGRSARVRDALRRRVPDQRLATPTFVAAATAGSWLAGLPRHYLADLLVERRFGLTRQSTPSWLADQAKGLGLSLALQTALASASYATIRRRPDDWWLILSSAAVPFAVVMSNLTPVLIMPLFNRFEPLSDPVLSARIEDLARRAGVPIAGVYRVDVSRQTEKANAFFTGLGHTKRIVLADTLLDRFEPDEIEAVVAHELGHQAHGDIWRLIGLGAALGYGAAFAASRLAPWAIRRTAPRTGVTSLGDEASLPILGLVVLALGVAVAPINAAVSRAIERRTDRFALHLTGDGTAYARTMTRLAAQNLSDPDPPRAVVLLLSSHPPIKERIAAAEAFARRAAAPAIASTDTRSANRELKPKADQTKPLQG